MKVICMVEDLECPKGLNICCHTCESWQGCDMACLEPTHDKCGYGEVINEELTEFQSAFPDVIGTITEIVVAKKRMEEQEKKLKEQLVKAMESYGVKAFENDHIKLTYVAPTTKTTIDSTKLKKEHPDIAEQYTKVSNVSASVRITVK